MGFTDLSNITQAVPFFMIADMDRSIVFYVEQLGFDLINKWIPYDRIEWCWLQRGGGSIMLQRFKEGTVWEGKRGQGVSIFFQCKDSIALYHEFLEKGVAVEEPFVGNNLWDLKLEDPDGYVLHFESPTEVPEETMYSDWKKNQEIK